MRVEMQDRDGRAVCLLQSSQGGQRDGVVAAERDELGVDVGGRVGVGPGAAGEELEVGFGHLAQGERVVEGRHGDVAAVEDRGPRRVGVYAGTCVEAAVGDLARGGGADGAGAEACSCEGE